MKSRKKRQAAKRQEWKKRNEEEEIGENKWKIKGTTQMEEKFKRTREKKTFHDDGY